MNMAKTLGEKMVKGAREAAELLKKGDKSQLTVRTIADHKDKKDQDNKESSSDK